MIVSVFWIIYSGKPLKSLVRIHFLSFTTECYWSFVEIFLVSSTLLESCFDVINFIDKKLTVYIQEKTIAIRMSCIKTGKSVKKNTHITLTANFGVPSNQSNDKTIDKNRRYTENINDVISAICHQSLTHRPTKNNSPQSRFFHPFFGRAISDSVATSPNFYMK